MLTLEQAVFAALQTDGRLAVAGALIDEASADARQAGAHGSPRIEFAYLFQHTNNPVFVFGNLLRQGNFTVDNFDLDALNNPDALSNWIPGICRMGCHWRPIGSGPSTI